MLSWVEHEKKFYNLKAWTTALEWLAVKLQSNFIASNIFGIFVLYKSLRANHCARSGGIFEYSDESLIVLLMAYAHVRKWTWCSIWKKKKQNKKTNKKKKKKKKKKTTTKKHTYHPCMCSVWFWTSLFVHGITKTRLFKYTENFTTKNWKFSDKKCWYFSYFCSKHRLWVLEYPQSMFLIRNKKIMYTPVNPSFTI